MKKGYFILIITLVFGMFLLIQYKSNIILDKDTNPQKTISDTKLMNNAEKTINIFKSNSLEDKSNRSEFFTLLKETSWNDMSSFDSNSTLEILDWIDSQKLSDEEIANFLNSTTGLDGAYAEKYSVVVSNIYKDDANKFLRLLSQNSEENIDLITGFIAYYVSSTNSKVIKDLSNKLLNSNEVNEKEKVIISNIINKAEVIEKQ